MFSIGDRVVLTRDHPDDNTDLLAGDEGTVVFIDNEGKMYIEHEWRSRVIGVCWDKPIERGHDCDVPDDCPIPHGWYIQDNDVSLTGIPEISITDFNELIK